MITNMKWHSSGKPRCLKYSCTSWFMNRSWIRVDESAQLIHGLYYISVVNRTNANFRTLQHTILLPNVARKLITPGQCSGAQTKHVFFLLTNTHTRLNSPESLQRRRCEKKAIITVHAWHGSAQKTDEVNKPTNSRLICKRSKYQRLSGRRPSVRKQFR